jgi:hypothetical protein
MTTVASTGIELEQHPHSTIVQRDVRNSSESDADPVLEASRVADSDVPDGGYGWVVIFACAVVSWWFTGTSYSWGIIQAALVKDGVGSPSTLSFVGSLSTALIGIMGISNAHVTSSIGTRWTAMLGVALLGLSGILSSFATQSFAGLFVTSGLVLGLGMRQVFYEMISLLT